MVEAPPAAGAPTPLLLCSLGHYHELRFAYYYNYADCDCLAYFFLGVSLGRSLLIVNWNVSSLSLPATDYIIGLFPKSSHERLCSLNRNSLISLHCASVTPGAMEYPDVPGDTT